MSYSEKFQILKANRFYKPGLCGSKKWLEVGQPTDTEDEAETTIAQMMEEEDLPREAFDFEVVDWENGEDYPFALARRRAALSEFYD